MIQAVIFDMDGLMIDSERLHHLSFVTVLEQYGISPEVDKRGVTHVQGISAEANWERFKKLYGFKASTKELTRKKQNIHLELLRDDVIAMPGLMELLEDLYKYGLKIAIASSSIRAHVDLVLEKLNISTFFDAITSGDEVIHSKPCPDIFLKAARKLGVNPKSCVVLEDALSGIQAAKAAGMYAIAVPNEFTKGEDFTIADEIVGSLRSLNGQTLLSLAQLGP